MSVISLSSGDEDEFVILDSDDEDSEGRSSQTHQVFIVERNQCCSFNEEVVLQNVTNNLGEPNNSYSCDNKIINLNSSSVVNSCQTLPKTNISTENKSESSLKLLAEKLAKVLGNNYSDVVIEQYDKATPETNMSSLEKTIFDVSRGLFTKFKQGNNILRNRTGKKTKGSRLLIKRDVKKVRKSLKKINSDFEIPQVKIQSSNIQSVQIVSEATIEHNQNSSQATICVDKNTNIQTNQRKRSLEPVENPVLNPKKKLSKHTKATSPQNSGPYDNKLKFTFDRSVSTYSVSVVSSSEPEQSEKNICWNSPHANDNEYPIEFNGSSCQKTIEETADFDLTEADPIDQPELIASGDLRSSPSPIPFSDILNLKSNFVKHHNIVFDDQTDVLCVEMGDLLLKIIEEENNLTTIMAKTQPSHDFLLGSDKFETTAKTCRDALHQSRRKFVDNFSQIHDQINIGHVVGTQLKIVLLTAWFMKMFLSITTKFPDFMDILHGVRIEALKLLSEETVKWPLISKTFIKDENQFYLDCVLVLELIKDCLKDQNELNPQSNLDLDQIVKADKRQTVTSVTSNNQVVTLPKERRLEKSHDLDQNINSDKRQTVTSVTSSNQVITLPKELQRLEKSHDLDVFVVMSNSTETKTTNYNGICKAESSPAKHFNILKTNLESHHELSSTIGYGSKKTGQNLTNPMLSVRSDLHYQNEASPFLAAQSDKRYCSNYTLNSNTDVPPNILYQPHQPNYCNHDTSNPSKHSQAQYNYNNQAHYQENSTNRFKTTSPITLNSFPGGFYPANLVASNSNMEQFPVLEGGGIEISSCPITINNYNITSYSPLSPGQISNYHNSSFKKKEQQL